MAIRNAARAILIRDGKVLLNRSVVTAEGAFWNLPRGATCYDLPGGGRRAAKGVATPRRGWYNDPWRMD